MRSPSSRLSNVASLAIWMGGWMACGGGTQTPFDISSDELLFVLHRSTPLPFSYIGRHSECVSGRIHRQARLHQVSVHIWTVAIAKNSSWNNHFRNQRHRWPAAMYSILFIETLFLSDFYALPGEEVMRAKLFDVPVILFIHLFDNPLFILTSHLAETKNNWNSWWKKSY